MGKKQDPDLITHPGIVISAAANQCRVQITANSACGHCRAKAYCEAGSESKDKVITASVNEKLSAGDQVNLIITRKMGMKAVFLAYFLPFLVFTAILIVINRLTGSELKAAGAAFIFLIFYYLFLYIGRSRLTRSFTFKAVKIAAKEPK